MRNKLFYNAIILAALFSSHFAFAAPQDPSVVAGSATISQGLVITKVDQTSQNAVINWRSFDTLNYEKVYFNQPSRTAITLNRITSGLPTNFAGSLFSNGRVFIVNPAGMVFTKGSCINTAGFLATTMDIKNNDFMNGNYKFFTQPGSENASIINNGVIVGFINNGISAEPGGFVALIAPNVINGPSGGIGAYLGSVVLASGATFVLDFNQDSLINFDASSLIKNGYIENAGEISAVNGIVFMTTNTVSQVLNNMINTSGITEANTVIKNNNEIILGSTEPKAGTITTNQIVAEYAVLNANAGITINGEMRTVRATDHAPMRWITAKTTTGNIAINSYIIGDYISLSAENGAITQSNSSTIWAGNLNTLSSTGTTLSGKNKIWNFTATNTASGGIYLKNYGEPVTKLGATGGDYKLDTIGFWEYYFGGND